MCTTLNRLVSIILPVYNGQRFLKEAIESCLAQSYSNFELIIVNDCSIDSSGDIAEEYKIKDSRISVIHNVTNKKLPASLNIGHRAAKGEFFTWTSDDNILKPNFLERLVLALENSNCDIVYSNYDIIESDTTLRRLHKTGPVCQLLFGNTIGASFIYKTKVFDTLNGYDENMHMVEDFDFWLRASLEFSFYHLNENLYNYRIHTSSLTQDINKNGDAKSLFNERIKKAYEKVGNDLKWHTQTIIFFAEISKGDKFCFFKRHQGKIIGDIKRYQNRVYENEKAHAIVKLNEILRDNLKDKPSIRSLSNLLWILKNQPGILFAPHYSKKETFKLLKKFFVKS